MIISFRRSEDEVKELFTISNGLLSNDIAENGNDDIIGNVAGVFDDRVSDEEENSDILETVAGEEEGNSGVFDGVSEDGINFVLNSA